MLGLLLDKPETVVGRSAAKGLLSVLVDPTSTWTEGGSELHSVTYAEGQGSDQMPEAAASLSSLSARPQTLPVAFDGQRRRRPRTHPHPTRTRRRRLGAPAAISVPMRSGYPVCTAASTRLICLWPAEWGSKALPPLCVGTVSCRRSCNRAARPGARQSSWSPSRTPPM